MPALTKCSPDISSDCPGAANLRLLVLRPGWSGTAGEFPVAWLADWPSVSGQNAK